MGELELRLAKANALAEKLAGNEELPLKRSELAVARAQLDLEKAKNRLHILTHYTKDHRIRELVMEVEKARSSELAKQATWELEKSKETKLERQIAACSINAPTDGTVVYAEQIEVGAIVRERQLILRIVPPPTIAPDRR